MGGVASSSCLRFFAFLANMFDGEMTLDEKFALQLLRRFASTPFDKGNPDHEEVGNTRFLLL